MKRSTMVAVAVAFATVAAACGSDSTTSGDGTVVIRGDAGCATCSLIADTVAVIPHPDDTLSLASYPVPALDSRGRYYGIELPSRRVVHVFGPNGRQVQSFGKPGRGPGEFSQILDIAVGTGDSLFVFENNRVLVFSPAFEYVREFDFGGNSSAPPGSTIILPENGFLYPSSPNHFSILNADGTLDSASARGMDERAAARAGATRPTMSNMVGIRVDGADTVQCRECGIRTFALAGSAGTLWSGSQHQYVITRNDLAGALQQRIVRETSWFAPWPADPSGASGHGAALTNEVLRREVQKARLQSIHEGADGILWAMVSRQNPDNPIPANLDLVAQIMSDTDDMDNYFVTVVEALDINRGELVATRNFAGQVAPLAGDLFVQVMRNDAEDRAFRILRLSVSR